jgi:NAD(P)-dependent dehydrogenase (short-subunit alcohol dehydrogenase family)
MDVGMPDREFSLKGQVALVTGSGRGLGHAMAARLAELGADVAIHDQNEAAPAAYGEFADLAASREDICRFDVRACAVVGDIADQTRVFDMAREVESALGPITILVNAAGGDIGASGGKPNPNNALDIKMEDVRALLDRNLIGTMLMCRAVVPGMLERRRGSVVNVASMAGHFGTSPEVAYSTIKAAIIHYTRCLAFETRDRNVRVNCVSPGATASARFLSTRTTDPVMMVADDTLVRYGVPRDQANAVAFLCTPAAGFIHGQVLRVDGGLSLYP